MDIMVQGTGKKEYTPDEVMVMLDFYTRTDTYEASLEKGVKSVEVFISDVLEKMNLNKSNMKTSNFRIYEETQYDVIKKAPVKLGMAYTQRAYIKFDYSTSKIAEFMDWVSKLENPPKYHLSFTIKDLRKCKSEALEDAYNKAKERAETIAMAAGKTLKECIKTDFRPFEQSVVSNSLLNSQDLMLNGQVGLRMNRESNVQETIQSIFTPEDVVITETLYCLWLAE